MSRDRVLAVTLFLIAFAGLVASKAFPFLPDMPEPAQIAIVFVAAASAMAGVRLWVRNASRQR